MAILEHCRISYFLNSCSSFSRTFYTISHLHNLHISFSSWPSDFYLRQNWMILWFFVCNTEITFALVCSVDMNGKPHLSFCVTEVLQFCDLEAHWVLLCYKDPFGLNDAISLYSFTIVKDKCTLLSFFHSVPFNEECTDNYNFGLLIFTGCKLKMHEYFKIRELNILESPL